LAEIRPESGIKCASYYFLEFKEIRAFIQVELITQVNAYKLSRISLIKPANDTRKGY